MKTTAAPPANAARILVVDDELGPRESLRMLLKPNYLIQTADSGKAALEQIPGYRPDIVILDIKMPEVDGLEVLRRIKRVDPAIEVVMITAYASLETVKLALTHGAFEYLIKPFSRQDLEDVVRRALLRRQAELGARGQVARLVEEMRRLGAKTQEAARREAVEQSLRVTQLSILREISRMIVGQLDHSAVTEAIINQLHTALGYDLVTIAPDAPPAVPAPLAGSVVITSAIRDAEGPLGWLVVDNRASGRAVDPRERELLEMLSEYLAIALRNARLYGQITDTKRSLEQLIASAGDAIITVTADDRIDGWNPAAERTFGLSVDQAIGRPVTYVLAEPEYLAARRTLAEGADRESFEISRVVTGEPRPLVLAITLSGLRNRQGGLDGVIAMVRDITTQREIEGQLHQSEKLTALGQLAGGIAHDFNNLLQAILGYAQLMKSNPGNAELIERSLTVVESAAIDGSETVRRIQQFARLRPEEQLTRVDINQIVQDAVAITRPRWDEKIARDRRPLDLRLDLQAVDPIQGRSAALSEVLTNLILNAMDAMPEGGRLSIATQSTRGRDVRITVADTGIGMPETVRQRIFEPFYSTKGEGGSGLGLSMTYSIVRRHGGEIHVDSEPGAGTTFTLVFPVGRETPAPEAPASDPRERRLARVLLVDDNSQVLSTLAEMMRAGGHTVTPTQSAPSALRDYAAGRFDVVITNIGMAEMNGWEFAERLRAVDARVPLLFITGWGLREEDHARLAGLGVRRCLFKPVRPEELDGAVQDVVTPR
jgi:PAS domain S-box-containing protein